jgi:hypothetical protein
MIQPSFDDIRIVNPPLERPKKLIPQVTFDLDTHSAKSLLTFSPSHRNEVFFWEISVT